MRKYSAFRGKLTFEYNHNFDADVPVPEWFSQCVGDAGYASDSDVSSMADYVEPEGEVDSEVELDPPRPVGADVDHDPFGVERLVESLKISDEEIRELKIHIPQHIDRRKYDLAFCQKKGTMALRSTKPLIVFVTDRCPNRELRTSIYLGLPNATCRPLLYFPVGICRFIRVLAI